MVPKVTVLMTVYNGLPYLGEAIDSVLAQTFEDFEFLIIDDASTDGSCSLIESYGDPRIRFVRNENNMSQVRSLNKGLRLAKGEYIARIDQDDMCYSTRFEKQIDFFQDCSPNVAVVGTWMKTITEDNQVFTRVINGERIPYEVEGRLDCYADVLFDLFKGRSNLSHPSVMFRKDIVLQVGGYDEEFHIAQDFDLWLRLAMAGFDARIIPELLVSYRFHGQQQTECNKTTCLNEVNSSHEILLNAYSGNNPISTLKKFFLDPEAFIEEVNCSEKVEKFSAAMHCFLENVKNKTRMSEIEYSQLENHFRNHINENGFNSMLFDLSLCST
jgi:glycosyltransferase involved in cell wall biosynthesis